jgi:peptidoglycan/LPS O-acetylase OafA/YrhL
MNRIPTLDGWRGIAVVLVLFDHIRSAIEHVDAPTWMHPSQHGVTIFFVLSGFLITSKLLEAPIDLRRFYIRRFFRLMPVAWTYLAVMLLLGHFAHMPIAPPAAVFASLFFYRNYLVIPFGASTFHFWSLSIEEQFYLVWPCILLLAGARRCLWIAPAGAIGIAFFRLLNWSHYNSSIFNCQTQARADALLIGCFLALALHEPRLRALALQWSKVWAVPALAVLGYCMAHFVQLAPLTECVSIAALIAASVLHPKSIFAWPLTTKALALLGTVSYSLYVWQEIFMLLMPAHGAVLILLNLFVMCLFVFASYEYVERPLTRFGHRLTRRQERSTLDAPALEISRTQEGGV